MDGTIWVGEATLTVFLIIFPISFKHTPIYTRNIFSKPVPLIPLPTPLILIAIRPPLRSLPRSIVISPIAQVNLSIYIDHPPFSIKHVIAPISFKNLSNFCHFDAATLLFVGRKETSPHPLAQIVVPLLTSRAFSIFACTEAGFKVGLVVLKIAQLHALLKCAWCGTSP